MTEINETAQTDQTARITLKPGLRLSSQVCQTQVVVVRPGSGAYALTCGGAPLVAGPTSPGGEVRAGFDGGSLLGKRYTDAAEGTLEVLVTRPGAGALADGEELLVLKEAKQLPASD